MRLARPTWDRTLRRDWTSAAAIFNYSVIRRHYGPDVSDRPAALWSLAGILCGRALNLAPVFSLTTGLSLIPDGPLMFFWMAGVGILSRIAFGKEPKRPLLQWLGVGFCLGLAMLSKYNGALLVLGTVLFLCTRSDQRHWLKHPGPYLALVLATAIFSPVLIRNARRLLGVIWIPRGEGSGIRGLACGLVGSQFRGTGPLVAAVDLASAHLGANLGLSLSSIGPTTLVRFLSRGATDRDLYTGGAIFKNRHALSLAMCRLSRVIFVVRGTDSSSIVGRRSAQSSLAAGGGSHALRRRC